MNGERSADDMGLVSYQLNGIMEHVPFQMRECDVRNSPRLGDEVSACFRISLNRYFYLYVCFRLNLIWPK